MWSAAESVVNSLEQRGGHIDTLENGSLAVTLDGKIIEVIPKDLNGLTKV